MKTAFPEHDRNRYRMIDATDYEENYARYYEHKNVEEERPSHLENEERSVEQMVISVGLAIIEAYMGRRPVHHLSPWLSNKCYRRVEQSVHKAHQMLKETFIPQPTNQQTPQPKVVLPRRIILQKVSPKAYEACLIVTDQQKARALALRAEYVSRRWRIATVEIA